MTDDQRIRVFVSYSHADKEWLDRLRVHLAPLERDHDVDVWEDTRIKPGTRWREAIREAVEQANVAVLLISADFLASDFIRTNELPPLLKAAEEEGALILPIITSPSLFEYNQDLSRFQSVNQPSAPLIAASPGEQEDVFVRVAETIIEKAEAVRQPHRVGLGGPERPFEEEFLEHATWQRLIKIGDWIFDAEAGRIVGSGMHAYLLSRQEYGASAFVIEASLAFSNFNSSADDSIYRMNAGIVFGWSSDRGHPRYYNILLSGQEVCIERIGFDGGDAFSDFQHISKPTPLAIEPKKEYQFSVRVQRTAISVLEGGALIQCMRRPTGVTGRVGLRPWRSQIECRNFAVRREMLDEHPDAATCAPSAPVGDA